MKLRVLVFGTFDRLHPGHVHFLERAAERGDLSVVIARDGNVERIKGRRPAEGERVRLRAVRAVVPGARVLLGDREDFLVPVRRLAPDLILLGYDQRLPPGVTEGDLPCPIGRLPAFHPGKWKSSLLRGEGRNAGEFPLY